MASNIRSSITVIVSRWYVDALCELVCNGCLEKMTDWHREKLAARSAAAGWRIVQNDPYCGECADRQEIRSSTDLNFYLAGQKDFVCLDCTLPICIEELKQKGQCAYYQTDRTDYYKQRYLERREAMLGHEIIQVKCLDPKCQTLVNPHKAKSGYCKPCYKRRWNERKTAIRRAKRNVTISA